MHSTLFGTFSNNIKEDPEKKDHKDKEGIMAFILFSEFNHI